MIIKLAKVKDKVCYILQAGEYQKAEDVVINGIGDADSEGIVMIDDDLTRYISNTQLDLKYIIKELVKVTEQIVKITEVKHWISATDSRGGPVSPVKAPLPDMDPIKSSVQTIGDLLKKYELQ